MFQIMGVDAENSALIRELSCTATKIIKEYYDPIIGPEQNDYMIEKFQSAAGIKAQISHGCCYYLVRDGEDIGFFAVYPKDNKMYLSKFYLAAQARGNGYGRKMFDFIKQLARNAGFNKVFLNVNKNNNETIHIYEHFGFKLLRLEKNDIGGGYFMDDYVLECEIV